MRLLTLLGPDLRSALESDPEGLREALAKFHIEDVAEILDDLPVEDAIALMQTLPAELAADVVEKLSADRQVAVLKAIEPAEAAEILTEMAPDDRVDVVQELPEEDAQELLVELEKAEPEAAEEVRELAGFGPETAGGLMTTEYVSLAPELKVWEGVEELRRIGSTQEAETLYQIYVCGYGNKLLGVVSLRDLIVNDPSQQLGDVMTENVVSVEPDDDQEHVAEVIARYDLNAVPVVDENEGMLGLVTVDDVVDVVIEEATEDAQKMGGIVPLEDSYFSTGLAEFVWKRGAWLVLLFLGQLLTATVMERHQHLLQSAVGLVLFIPLIIASGGNAGSQSSTLIIRAMAVGELEARDWLRVLGRELGIGLALGVALGAIGFARAYVAGNQVGAAALASAVGASVVAIVTLSTVVGSLLPLGIRRLGLDPAVSSTPFIASVVDVLGLLVYFALAQLILFHLL